MTVRIITGDCRAVLATLPAESVHCCVSSPPYYGLRDYGVAGQIGLEPSHQGFVSEMVVLIELNPQYADMARKRICGDAPLFAEMNAS